MSRQKRYLLDTNIWLDVYLGDRENHRASSALLAKLIEQESAILYPASALSDVAYIVAATLKRSLRESGQEMTEGYFRAINEISWACADNMTELAAIAPLDSADVRVGMKHRALHDDLEDDLVIAAGLRAEVDFLITNDKDFLGRSPLPTLSSPDMLALLTAHEQS